MIARFAGRRRDRLAAAAALLPVLVCAAPRYARAQTDYYNTDAGRPLQVEDAYPLERRAVEVQAAPLRVERSRAGIYTWGIEPEIAVGVLPRTQFELGLPVVVADAGAGGTNVGISGVDASLLHNLNVETRLPALAVGASLLAPVGSLAAEGPYASFKGIATKTFRWVRVHANAQYTLGDTRAALGVDFGRGAGAAELSRWMAGVALDRAFPLQSFLVGAEVVARRPLSRGADVEWDAAAGSRVQLTPRIALDFGAGANFTGGDRGWFATVGGAYVVGLPWRGTGGASLR